MNSINILWMSFVGMVIIMTVLYVLHLRKQDAGIVDLGWTAGIGLVAILLAATGDGWLPRRVLVASLITLWSARLFTHILVDRIKGKEEDARYHALRNHWGPKANRNFFFLFQLQSVLVVLFVLPVFALVQIQEAGFSPWEYLGLAVWLTAFFGEALADKQLARFRAQPSNRGKVCQAGLWKYSRHPNYFFEWLHWCAYPLIGLGHPLGWLTLVGPVLMWLFLWNITGIPFTEKRALASRGEAYKRYQQSTSVFFPWFPKHST